MSPQEMASHLMFHVKHEAFEDLTRFGTILAERNEVMNLVGPATIPHYWSRHVLDSAQLLNHAPDAKLWADLGAGAGFPGVVLAILVKHMSTDSGETPTDRRVFLIDSLAKRCRFLGEVVRELDLPATVINDRAENVSLKVDVVTARAMAPLPKLIGFAESFFRKGAEGWLLKGESVEAEIAEAQKGWAFQSELFTSLSDPRGRVLHIRSVRRAR
ncbi:16S rRNA (guanine(527)-N(7))-methyltransferase RsmG [Asticcacaulis sp. AND118]|uniref:16S rRNA (guanine(527)-N(7))-methyltransferase RsmG n=1 Tax=Asticcacaulis sp. AND118 TaxID=2840468 RepID=UPI001CFF8934|nr:16S rRNA (guanine(527)-N(7))-methyltransferase RsmG [Asticcacaulis sp. AND118]UDF04830.1 16S rRNA (guanine(527)-N(7))-methyltransferase RsmG [Asticcacaulis sp. AND118]